MQTSSTWAQGWEGVVEGDVERGRGRETQVMLGEKGKGAGSNWNYSKRDGGDKRML